MRFGRNVARTFFEYYRFTNVLIIPITMEIGSRKGRPKTHRPRGRSRLRNEIKVRPKTTRTNAPISYTDLSIRYDSSTSNEGSPIRYGQGHYGYGFGSRPTGNIYMNQDQFSLLAIQSSKFNNLDFSNEFKSTTTDLPRLSQQQQQSSNNHHPFALGRSREPTTAALNIPPKPYLSIIDFNQLTRGGLERAQKRLDERKNLKHYHHH